MASQNVAAGSSAPLTIQQTVIDAFSGDQVQLPSLDNPLPFSEIVTVSGNRVMKIGESVIIKLHNVKPSTQVWITESSGSDPMFITGANVAGGYAGMTDGQGEFVWQTTAGSGAYAYQERVYQIWVGNWDGQSPRADSDLVPTLIEWVTDSSGIPAPPPSMLEPIDQ
jgi:hypothetical protein